MNETKHTKGPWTIRDRTGTVGNPAMDIEGPQGEVVARVIYQDGFGALQANAQLIASAPELLEALQEIAKHTDPADEKSYRTDDREGCLDTVHALSKAAIAKAKGGAA